MAPAHIFVLLESFRLPIISIVQLLKVSLLKSTFFKIRQLSKIGFENQQSSASRLA